MPSITFTRSASTEKRPVIADATLNAFVKEALAAGESRERIASVLKSAGWPEDQIAEALGAFAEADFPTPVPRPRRYGGAREAFLYIVFFALLGVFAVQLGALAFAFVDAQFADPLDDPPGSYAVSRLRWSIASLIVGYPVFVALGWRLNAARRKNPERRVSRVRAWLTYVTLIFAALILIGDLVAVVYNFLSGELGSRFMAKAVIVGVISAGILLNFTRDAERQTANVDWVGRSLAVAASIITAALVLWAFFLVDTPGAARARTADLQRMQDVQALARQVDCYRTYFGEKPESLEAMETALQNRTARAPAAPGCAGEAPRDPANDMAYRYDNLAGEAFRLCASFTRGWPDRDEGRRPTPNYYVGGRRRNLERPRSSGETCFDLEAIDFEADDAAERSPPEGSVTEP